MSQFEFISGFLSIIFGLAVAHLLAGLIQQIYRGRISYQRFAYTVLTLTAIILQWWTLFLWRDVPVWTFETFFVLVVWALAFFSLAVSVYPPGLKPEDRFVGHRRTFLRIWIGALALDMVQTALRGELMHPPFYIPFVAHYMLIAALAIQVPSVLFQRVIATYMPVSLMLWAFLVRQLVS